MARQRKTHVQQELRWHNAAGDLRGRKREAATAASRRGKRKLGRPRKPGAKQRHVKRPAFASERVVHVTLRVERAVGKLRTRACYRAIREAAVTVLPHEDCRIVQLSIQSTHVHLLVEADHSKALSRGMQAFQVSAAKHINAAISGAGRWWERRQWL
ncbi:MAG TPA: transposase, partial [Kofleriaceae bacterium]|nr:transposase [Kofleriaceae bacterium]